MGSLQSPLWLQWNKDGSELTLVSAGTTSNITPAKYHSFWVTAALPGARWALSSHGRSITPSWATEVQASSSTYIRAQSMNQKVSCHQSSTQTWSNWPLCSRSHYEFIEKPGLEWVQPPWWFSHLIPSHRSQTSVQLQWSHPVISTYDIF